MMVSAVATAGIVRAHLTLPYRQNASFETVGLAEAASYVQELSPILELPRCLRMIDAEHLLVDGKRPLAVRERFVDAIQPRQHVGKVAQRDRDIGVFRAQDLFFQA